jgi:hypothetical protein
VCEFKPIFSHHQILLKTFIPAYSNEEGAVCRHQKIIVSLKNDGGIPEFIGECMFSQGKFLFDTYKWLFKIY